MCDPSAAVGRGVTSSPQWRSLYAITLTPLVALAILEVAGPTGAMRAVERCLATMGAFVGMACWVRGNRGALDLHAWCACASPTVTRRVVESCRPGPIVSPVAAEADDGLVGEGIVGPARVEYRPRGVP
jgi:hypothetical protein